MQEEKILTSKPSAHKTTRLLVAIFVIILAIIIALAYLIPKIIPISILSQAEKAYQAKQNDKAITLYRQLVRNFPSFVKKNPSINYHLGISYLAKNKPYRASSSFSKFLESNPPEEKMTPQVRFLIGLTFNDTEKYYQAIQQLEKVPLSDSKLKIEPLEYHLALAKSYFGKKKFDKALLAADKTLEIAESKSTEARKAHLIKFLILYSQEKYAEAKKESAILGKFQFTDLDLFEVQFYQEEQFYIASQEGWLEQLQYDLETSQNINNFLRATAYTILGQYYLADKKVELASSYLEKALETDPDYLPAYYALSYFYTTQKDYQKALEYDQKALEIDENDPLVRNGIGWSYYNLALENSDNQEQLKLAEDYFKKAVNLDPEFAIAHNNLGLAYKALDQNKEALSSFQTAIDLDPKYKKPYLNIGSTYLAQKKYDKVLEFYQKALEIDPDYALAYYAIGNFYFSQKKYPEAIASIQKSQKLDPKYLNTYKLLADIFVNQGQPQRAIDELNKGLKVKEDDGLYTALSQIYRDLGDTKKSEELFAKGLSLQPNSSTVYQFNLGLKFKREGKFKEAKEQLTKALNLAPKDKDTHIALAQVEGELKNYDEAIKLLQKALTIDPEDINIYDELGTAYSEKGDYQAAITTYKKALTLDLKVQKPSDIARVYENLGLVYHNNTKQFDLAEEAFKNALKYDPKQATIYINLGETYRVKGMLKEAASQQRIALQLDPKNALAHNNLGYTLALQGNIAEAILEFKKAVEIDPNLKIAKENLENFQKK